MDKNRYFQIRSGKYIKTKVADIQRLCSKWLWLVTVVYKLSFADAELGKDGSEDFVVGDFARDGAQMVEYAAELLAEQIRGQRTVDSDKRPSESRVGRCQGFVVAGRRDHGIAVVEGIGVDCRAERLPQAVDAHPFAGGNGDRAGGKGGAGGLVDFIDDVDDPTVRSRTDGGGAVGWCGGKVCFRKV